MERSGNDNISLRLFSIQVLLLPLTTVNKCLQIFQLSFENVGADKDKYTWLVSEGCKSEKIAECENWAFFLKNGKMSAMQKDLVQGGTCI